MRVLLLNGSPHAGGCTAAALREIEKTLQEEGVETEWLWIGPDAVRGCTVCGWCGSHGKCVYDQDMTNSLLERFAEMDGLVVGAPVHFAAPSASLLVLLDKAFYIARKNRKVGRMLAHKPAAMIVSARRAGTTAALDVLGKYFAGSEMPIVSGGYWNMVHGASPAEVVRDLEGMRTMRTVARNLAWLLKCMEAGKAQGVPFPSEEEKVLTNFIR